MRPFQKNANAPGRLFLPEQDLKSYFMASFKSREKAGPMILARVYARDTLSKTNSPGMELGCRKHESEEPEEAC
jgi:hypothetical protein